MLRFLVPVVLLLLTAGAQEVPPDVASALSDWRSAHGEGWHVILDPETGKARTLLNGAATGSFSPRDDAEHSLLARQFFTEAFGIFGVEPDTLVADRVHLLPLAQVGLTDKMTARFRQVVGGIPVLGGSIDALFNMQGQLLCLSSEGLPRTRDFETTATVSVTAAADLASFVFQRETGVWPFAVGSPNLAILQHYANGRRSGVLVWEVEVYGGDLGGVPLSYLYRVAARDVPEVVDREDLVQFAFPQQQPIRGTVKANVTDDPAFLPDNGTNFGLMPVAYIHIREDTGSGPGDLLATTDSDGKFTLPFGSTLEVWLEFEGPYAVVENINGKNWNPIVPALCNAVQYPTVNEHVKQAELTSGSNTVVINPDYDEQVVAQANIFLSISQMRDWIRSVDPGDSTFDDQAQVAPFLGRANVGLDYCNAQFGSALQCVGFARTWTNSVLGTECVQNTAYPMIIWHEMGHWLNDLYRNAPGGSWNEGIADVWAMYIADFGIYANGFLNEVGIDRSRDGNNSLKFCGDCPEDQNCHPLGPQENGKPLMGAMWKARANLKNKYAGPPYNDETMGAAIADALFLAWMKAFDTNEIKSVIEYQLLMLDDDDGILSNGTPNILEIDEGFSRLVVNGGNEFPGFQWPPIPDSCPSTLCGTLKFTKEDDGVTLLVNGQDITTPPEFGNVVSISATGLNNFGAAIFDSTPGGPNATSADPDLLVGTGNLLILQEDQTQTVSGIFDNPDDAQLGGTMIFDFVNPVELFSVNLIDICPGPPSQDVTVIVYDGSQPTALTRTYTVPGGWTEDVFVDGPPGYRSLYLNTLMDQPGFQATATATEDVGFNPQDAVRLEVSFSGSGALDNLIFCEVP